MHTHLRWFARLLPPLLVLSIACTPKSQQELAQGRGILVHGVVTDAGTGRALPGVTVHLNVAQTFPAATTDARGYFSFANVTQLHNLIVQFDMPNYVSKSITIDSNAATLVVPDGGSVAPDSLDASIGLTPDITLTLAGWVWAGKDPAVGAQVALVAVLPVTGGPPGATFEQYVTSTTADAGGHFTINKVVPGPSYILRVWPYDRPPGDGVADYRLYNLALGKIDSTDTNNLTNLVISLEDEVSGIVASGFANLSTDGELAGGGHLDNGYPLKAADLTAAPDGVTATALGPIAPLWMHFGSEVDTASAVFQLVPMDRGTAPGVNERFGNPIALTAQWQNNVILTLVPATPLTPSADPHQGYQLRIRSLRFLDGTTFIDPTTPGVYGKITFNFVGLPSYLNNPTPAVHVANLSNHTTVTNSLLTASGATIDAAGAFITDTAGDFIFGYGPGGGNWNGGTGLQLQWQHVPGATSYRVYAHNLTTAGNIGDDRRQWKRLNGALAWSVDPNGQTTVLATGVMSSTGPNGKFADFGGTWTPPGGATAVYPWLWGNPVEFAVTSVDVDGYEAPIDPTKTLVLRDSVGPMVTSASLEPGVGLNSDFRAGAGSLVLPTRAGAADQRGNSFRKVVTVPFSEPILSITPPAVTAKSATVRIRGQGTASFDPNTPDTLVNISDSFALPVDFSSIGACTEVMVARSGILYSVNAAGGDTVIPVRDASLFAAGSTNRALFLSAGGAWIDELTGIGAADTTLNRLTFAKGLQHSVAAGSLVCFVDAPASAAQHLISLSASTVSVNDASLYHTGQAVFLYRPQVSGAGQLLESFSVAAIDTTSTPNTVVLSSAPSTTHNATSVLMPLPTGGEYGVAGIEYGLRPSVSMTGALKADAAADLVKGTVTLSLSSASPVAIGDTVVLDVDGDTIDTWADQWMGTIKSIQYLPNLPAPTYTVVVQLAQIPSAPVLFIHGQSAVIDLGDALQVSSVQDTSSVGGAAHGVNPRQDTFTADGLIF